MINFRLQDTTVAKGSVISLLHSRQLGEVEGPVAPGPLLRLTLCGQMQAEDEAGRNILPRSRKTRAVLAVLALAAPKPVLRTRLTRLLWSGRATEQGRGSLRQSVYELQQTLGADTVSLLRTTRDQLALLDDRLWLDTRMLASTAAGQPIDLRMFRAPLLEDLDGLDPAFDAWLAEERRQILHRGIQLAEAALAAAQNANDRRDAAEQLLAIERTHEGGWQALIRADLELRDRTAARLAYERCLNTLASAGLLPSRETSELLRCTSEPNIPPGTSTRSPTTDQRVRLCVLPLRVLGAGVAFGPMPGLAEELSLAISRFRWIACSVGAGPGEAGWQVRDADYMLDATLQRGSNRVRIIVRLLDPQFGSNVLWAHSFDSGTTDLLELQHTIATETAAHIDPQMLMREGDRRNGQPSTIPNAFELTLRAIPPIYRLEPSGFRAAGELLANAVDLDPAYAAAHAWWAYWRLLQVGQAWASDPLAATQHAGQLAERAVTLDPGDARALALVGHVRAFLHRQPEEACVLHERALSLNPALPLAWCYSGLAHGYLGRHGTAIEQISRAQTLAPHDPHAFFFDTALMLPYLLQGDFEKALASGRRALELNPGFTSTYKGYLATLGQLNRTTEAARVLARLLELEPGFCVRSALERSPMKRLSDQQLYAEGLRRAGLPEG
jgi:DNA-binding SARP family transcriptional activator/tetratricopeptide (TPR) repeat protein